MKPPRSNSRQLLDNDAIAAWIFLFPALILLGVFLLWPIAYLFYLSFTTGIQSEKHIQIS